MELVRFEDGKYGIKRKWLFGLFNQFLDLDNGRMWWESRDAVQCWCKREDQEKVMEIYRNYMKVKNAKKHTKILTLL